MSTGLPGAHHGGLAFASYLATQARSGAPGWPRVPLDPQGRSWRRRVPYGRILVPLDGSELAETALLYAALVPSQSIRLLAVEPVVLSAVRMREARGEESPWGVWPTRSATYLKLVGLPFEEQGRVVEVAVMAGDPKRRIVEASADADLIVMATRGQGAATVLLGSVADYVARHARIPTLLVRDEHPAMTLAVLRVVVPLDGSGHAEEALPVATTLREALGARLHLIQAVDPATSLARVADLERDAAAYLTQQLQQLGAGSAATQEVLIGPAGRRLREALRPGDLVVMATRGRGGVGRLVLGSVATAVVRRAPVPVVLVRVAPSEMARALADATMRPEESG